jgi:hypothetical protein
VTIFEQNPVIDQFALHEQAERKETSAIREAFGPNWVIARRTKAIVARYGETVRCVSQAEYDAVCLAVHVAAGCPPRCPTRKRLSV